MKLGIMSLKEEKYNGPPHIYTISLEGGNPKRLSLNQTPDFHPCWSPDGKKIAFASTRAGNMDILFKFLD